MKFLTKILSALLCVVFIACSAACSVVIDNGESSSGGSTNGSASTGGGSSGSDPSGSDPSGSDPSGSDSSGSDSSGSDSSGSDSSGGEDLPGGDEEGFDRGDSGPVLTGEAYNVPQIAGMPAAYGPVPSASQMKYYEQGLSMFIHFGINTFTGAEWGDGTEDPKAFNPTDLDTDQWVQVAQEAGFGRIILTAKHHDGFVLYPTEYTDHSVASSDWQNGEGDVLREFFDSCEKYGMDAGIYLSPWDRNMPSYSVNVPPDYNDTYVGMVEEIFERYGNDDHSNIVEFWLDGACGEPETRPTYDYARWWETMYAYNPDIVIKSEYGSTVHWVGTYEADLGWGGDEAWQTYNKEYLWSGFPDKKPSTSAFNKYINNGVPYIEGKTGQENANIWSVSEADISIRTTASGETGAWFWDETDKTRTPENLADIYFRSVGRGGVFLLNVPPTNEGKFEQCDIDALTAFREILDNTFGTDKALGAKATASATRGNNDAFGASNLTDGDYDSYWTTDDGTNSGTVTVEFDQPTYMDVVELQEYIPLGQRINSFSVEVRLPNGTWMQYGDGTTVGYKRLVKGIPVTADAVRVTVETVDGDVAPLLNHIGVYKADSRIEEEVKFTAPGTIDAADYDGATGGAKAQTKGGYNNVGSIKESTVLTYNNVFFDGEPENISFFYAGNGNDTSKNTVVKVRIDDPSSGPVIATCVLAPTGSYYKFEQSEAFEIDSPEQFEGYHNVYLTFEENPSGNAGINLSTITFGKSNTIALANAEIFADGTAGMATLTLVRSAATDTAVSATVRTRDGSGVAGKDYTAVDQTVTFAAGETEKTVQVPVNLPAGGAGLYDFTVEIADVSGSAYIGGVSAATVTVIDPAAKENFSIGTSISSNNSAVSASGIQSEKDGVTSTEITIKGSPTSGAGKILTIANGAGDGFAATGKKQVVCLNVTNNGSETVLIRYYVGASGNDLMGVTMEIGAGESIEAYFAVEANASSAVGSYILIGTNFGTVPLTVTGYVIG